jgi:hypothetical protein
MKKSSHYIKILLLQSYLLISHFMIHRDSSENRDLRSSRDYFLLIKLSSSSVVISIWFHQNRILIFVLINLSTISKISKYERNHLDLNKSSWLNGRRTTRFEVNKLMKKLTIRIVSNKQMRFEVESFMHEELNDDVMKQKSIDQIRWSNHLIKKISSRKESSSVRSRFAISSIHLIISNYHDTASSTIFQQFVSFVNNRFLRLMLKHRINDASSCFMIIYDQDEIIDIKEIIFWNIQLLEEQLIDNCLNVFVDTFVDHELERNKVNFLQF